MKALLLPLLVLACVAATPAPPIPRSIPVLPLVSLKLTWGYPADELSSDLVFRVYHTTNLATSNIEWQVITNVPGTQTNVIIQAIPGVHYYAVKSYSGFWDLESSFSTVASTPPAPRSDITLSIGRP